MSMLITLIMSIAVLQPHHAKNPGPSREDLAIVASGPVVISPWRRAATSDLENARDQYIYYSLPYDFCGYGFGGCGFGYFNRGFNYGWGSRFGWGNGVLGDPTH